MHLSKALIGTAALFLLSGNALSQQTNRPAAVQALEAQGLAVIKEFEAGKGLRGFAGIAASSPVSIYVLPNGEAIVGTRLSATGKPLDSEVLEKLVAQPMQDKEWDLLAESTWVLDGKADAPRIVYTFSDANCPYCNRFWQAARPWVDAGKVQLRHIMVGVIRTDSSGKAAAILTAPDRSAALLENERNFSKGGIAPLKPVPEKVDETLAMHRMLMMATGFRGTPGIVFLDDKGAVQKINGMPQGASLSKVLGPR